MNTKFVVSACLVGQACRYDGGSNPCPEIIRLAEEGVAVPLCPEQLGGLSTPRSPCEMRDGVVISRDGHDCTAAFKLGAERALHLAQDAGCTMAILKARSPSCGANGVYDGTFTKHLVPGDGLCASTLRQAGFQIFTDEDVAGGKCKALHLPLTTHRLLLRQWQSDDKVPFAALNADPEVMEHFPSTLNRNESDALADRFSGLITKQGWGFWAVERKADGAFMGFVGLHRPENLPFSPCTEVGWRLARAFWGHGYATEAARACLGFAFDVLHETSVVSFTAVSNERSQAVMRRIGMEQESYFEHPAVPVGHRIRPHVLFRLRRDNPQEA